MKRQRRHGKRRRKRKRGKTAASAYQRNVISVSDVWRSIGMKAAARSWCGSGIISSAGRKNSRKAKRNSVSNEKRETP